MYKNFTKLLVIRIPLVLAFICFFALNTAFAQKITIKKNLTAIEHLRLYSYLKGVEVSEMEHKIRSQIKNAIVTIHPEPN